MPASSHPVTLTVTLTPKQLAWVVDGATRWHVTPAAVIRATLVIAQDAEQVDQDVLLTALNKSRSS